MKRIKIALLACMVLLFSVGVYAQKSVMSMNVNYSLAMPAGDFSNSVSDNSPRGWNIGIQYGITDRITVGLGVGYQDFYQKNARQLFKLENNTDVSAVLTHSIQTMPIMAEGKYYFLPQSVIQPFVGLGIGGNIIMYRRFLGEFPTSISAFKFAAHPEAGINIPVGKSRETGITLAAGYDYMPFNKDGIKSLDNFNVRVGVKFPLRNR